MSIWGFLTIFWSPSSLGRSETVIQPVSSERKSQWQWGRGRGREWGKALPWQTSRCPSMFTQWDNACYLTTEGEKNAVTQWINATACTDAGTCTQKSQLDVYTSLDIYADTSYFSNQILSVDVKVVKEENSFYGFSTFVFNSNSLA